MGVMSQTIALEQPEHVGPGSCSMSPARMSSSWRSRAGLTTLVTEKTAAFQVSSSVYCQAGFVGLLEKALARDAKRRHACSRLVTFHGAPRT